jgi:hypothetical protein
MCTDKEIVVAWRNYFSCERAMHYDEADRGPLTTGASLELGVHAVSVFGSVACAAIQHFSDLSDASRKTEGMNLRGWKDERTQDS